MKNLITSIEKKENPRETKFQHNSSTRPNTTSPLADFQAPEEDKVLGRNSSATRKIFTQNISIFWFVALVVFSFCVTLAPRFGYYLEDAQAAFFPVLLFSFFMLPKKKTFRIPSLVVFFCILGWGHSVLKTSGVFSFFPTDSRLYLSRLSNDDMEVTARDLKRRVNEIAATYHLSTLELLPQSLIGASEQKKWLSHHPDARLIIGGDKHWLVVTARVPFLFHKDNSSTSKELFSLETESRYLGLTQGVDYDPLFISGLNNHFLLSSRMLTFSLPSTPTELSRHYLAWLAAGLDEEESFHHIGLGYLYEAQQVLGLWKSSGPLAVAHFFSALGHLLLALEHETSVELGEVNCALDQFKQALAKVRQKYEPELYATFFNNAAVAKLVAAQTEKDYQMAEAWLLKAAKTRTKQGEATQGTKLALLNLITLTRTGILF